MIRYGIIGLRHGMSHAGAIHDLAGATLTALCDTDAARLTACAERYGISPDQCFSDCDALLARAPLDAVVVATPVHTHKDLALRVLAAGKHLLLEKAIAHTVADGRAIVAAAADHPDRVAQIGYCVRSSPFVAKLREILAAGHIGDPLLFWFNMFLPVDRAKETWRNERALMGGKLFDCCCHYLDVMMLLAGTRWQRTCAFGGPIGYTGPNGADLPELCHLLLEMENGVRITLNLSEHTPAPRYSGMGIAGTRGKLEADPWWPHGAGSIRLWESGGLYETEITVSGELASCGHLGFREQHVNFLRSIAEGAPPVCTPADAMETLLLNAALDASLRHGRVVLRSEIES